MFCIQRLTRASIMRMVRLILTVTLLAAARAACGQSVIDPGKNAQLAEYFEPHKEDKLLRCDASPIRPSLNFSFRFQSGYVFRVPLKQFEGGGHRWSILTRVRPADGGAPSLLGVEYALPRVSKTKSVVEWGGVFWVGEGSYVVDWMLFDELNRVCRKEWKIDAKLSSREHGVDPGIAPGKVAEVSFRGWSPQETADVPVLNRLTIFLHAAPLFPRLTRLRVQDRLTLLGSLASLLESVPARAVRLVIFNLDQQKELFRDDDFTPEAFPRAARSMSSLQLQVVDYHVLANQRGHVDLLKDLVNQEVGAAQPADAVIFLGPAGRYLDKVPKNAIEEHPGDRTHFFYLQYKPYMRETAEFPDSIELAVRKVHGRKLVIRTPEDFAKSIKQVEAQILARN
jgi:hypothetical protein